MSRKLLVAVSVVIALTLALGVGVVAFAQGAGKTPTAQDSSFVAHLAQRLNLTTDAVTQAMRDAAKDTVAQAAQSGKLTQDQATKLDTRIDRWQGRLPLGFLAGAQAAQAGQAVKQHLSKVGLDAAATALGMTAKDVLAQLKQGQTLRQLATAKSVDPQAVLNAIVSAEKAEIDKAATAGKLTTDQASKAKAKIDARAATLLDQVWPAKGQTGQGQRGMALQPGARVAYQAAAQTLGMTQADLLAQLKAGQTLRQLATAKGVDAATVEKAMADAITARVDQAVQAGQLKVERATQAKAAAAQTAARLMDAPLTHYAQPPAGSKRQK